MSKATVLDVANYILDTVDETTTMKLQKLCYYCQAWSLAWDEKPLFKEDFHAWANGPVCKELFRKHKGKYSVDKHTFPRSSYKFTEEETDTMDSVIKYYSKMTPMELSELTHKERPWKETRGELKLGEPCDKVIKKNLMQEYYSGLI